MKKRLLWFAPLLLVLGFSVSVARGKVETKPTLRAGMTYDEVVQRMEKSSWEYKVLPAENYGQIEYRLKSHSINANSLSCVLSANSPQSSTLSCIEKYDFSYVNFDKSKKVVNFDEDSSCLARSF